MRRYQAVINSIQTINARVANAPALEHYPTSLTTAHLPIILTWPGNVEADFSQIVIPLEVDVIIEAIAQGDFNEVKQTCLRLMDDIIDLYTPYLDHQGEPLSYDPVVQIDPGSRLRLSPILPSPLNGATINYPFQEYHGFKANLTVIVTRIREKTQRKVFVGD